MSGTYDPVFIVDKQTEIIEIQAGVIDELFKLLSQHIDAEEVAALPCIDEIGRAVEIRNEIGERP